MYTERMILLIFGLKKICLFFQMESLDLKDLDFCLFAQKSRIIHQVWFGTMPNKREANKTYKKFKKYRDSWKVKNPTWYHMEWDKRMSELFVFNFFPEHYDLYINYVYEIQKCDAIRYMILYRYGGLYVDMDYYCVKSFDEVFSLYKSPLYLVQTPNRSGDYVSNSLMYSVANHPYWKSLLVEMEIDKYTPIYYSKHLTVMFTTGPGLVNRVYQKYKRRYKLKSWPHKYFQPHTHTENVLSLKNDDVYAIHMSDGCWHGNDSTFIVLFCKEWVILLYIFCVLVIGTLIYKITNNNKKCIV
jgi:mannosyltransferase OCH1-like enzyme